MLTNEKCIFPNKAVIEIHLSMNSFRFNELNVLSNTTRGADKMEFDLFLRVTNSGIRTGSRHAGGWLKGNRGRHVVDGVKAHKVHRALVLESLMIIISSE